MVELIVTHMVQNRLHRFLLEHPPVARGQTFPQLRNRCSYRRAAAFRKQVQIRSTTCAFRRPIPAKNHASSAAGIT